MAQLARWALRGWRAPVVSLLIAFVLAAPLFGVIAIQSALKQLGPLPDGISAPLSVVVLDRKGQLLRPFANPLGRWRLPVTPSQVDPRYLEMLLRYEDKRFYSHRGIDPLALIRAAGQLVVSGRVVSGASTLTMQVARLMEPRRKRSPATKFRQMLRALQLEAQFSKREILGLYLTLAPFGGNLEGIRAASLAYFSKEPRRLTLDEAALLIALPQSPETRRPDRFAQAARRARDQVLARSAQAGILSEVDAARALTRRVPTRRRAFPMHAAHVSAREAARSTSGQVHRLTIDRNLQVQLEELASKRVTRFGTRHSIAMIVVENRTGNILAHVGSSGYFDAQRAGQIDMANAIRSPGSALKPFIYALAFEAGLAHPETLIEDSPRRFGDYAPGNFDSAFRGTVTLREALHLSLNIPAVQLLDAIGPATLLARLRMAGARIHLPGSRPADLPIALGGMGIRLTDLAMLYSSFPRLGKPGALRYRLEGEPVKSRVQVKAAKRPMLSPVASWYVADILRGTPPPVHGKRGAFAFKTGTSYGYRDAWAAGFDGRHTVAVWVGRPDGGSSPGMTGHGAAAPVLSQVFARLGAHRTPLPPAPRGAIVSATAELPLPLREFGGKAGGAWKNSSSAPRIAFPPEGSRVALLGAAPGLPEAIALKAESGTLPLTWFINGAPLIRKSRQRTAFWKPDGEGFVHLTLVDGKGLSDSVVFRLETEGRAAPARRLLIPQE